MTSPGTKTAPEGSGKAAGALPARDRVVELRRVQASDLRQNPRNWRRHPESQARALRSILGQVGYADALLARETPEGLELLDGHLRRDLAGDETVPVLVVDLTQEEADLLLMTLDPLGAMSEVDPAQLGQLMDEIVVGQEDLDRFLVSLLPPEDGAARATAFLDDAAEGAPGENAWAAPAPDHPFFTITVAVTAEERDIIRSALNRAKDRDQAQTTQAALVAICRRYLDLPEVRPIEIARVRE